MDIDQLKRVRHICLTLPETSERISHGESTFFVHKRVYAMFANNHHNDGRIAVWIPVPPDFQAGLIESAPAIYFRPPYVGPRGWVGIVLAHIRDEDLRYHLTIAWELIAPKRLLAQCSIRLPEPTRDERMD